VGLRARSHGFAASIPIAVLAIRILRAFGRSLDPGKRHRPDHRATPASPLRGRHLHAAALIFLVFDLEYARIFVLALIGGFFGVLFMCRCASS